MRILVVWEDEQYDPLARFIKLRLASRKPEDVSKFPEVLFHTSQGNGRFAPYVRDTWPRVRTRGLPNNPGPLDRLLCIVDGDKIHELLRKVPSPTAMVSGANDWHQQAMRAWKEHLQELAEASPPGTVHGYVLRWSKESLVLAGFDLEPVSTHLELDFKTEDLQRLLDNCKPDPRSLSTEFSNSYLKPLQCLESARKSIGKPGHIKNSPELDDALVALAQHHLASVCCRVPDLDSIVDLIWSFTKPPVVPVAPVPTVSSKSPEKKTAKSSRAKRNG